MADIKEGESQDTDSSTEKDLAPKPLTSADLEAFAKTLPNLVNSAVTAHLKKTKNQVLVKPDETTEATETDSKEKLSLASMKRELDALKSERDLAKQEARASKVITKVSTALEGKVNPTFKDLAVEQVIKGISFDNDEASFTLGGEVYDVDSGIEAWTKHPSNKRFAIVQEARKQSSALPNFTHADLKETDMMAEAGIDLLGSLLMPKLKN